MSEASIMESFSKEPTINLLVNPKLQCPEARFLYEQKCNLDFLEKVIESDTSKIKRRISKLYKSAITSKQHYHLAFIVYDGGAANKSAGLYVEYLDSLGTNRGLPLDSPELYIRCQGIDHIQLNSQVLFDRMLTMKEEEQSDYCAYLNWAVHVVSDIYTGICLWNVLKTIDRKKLLPDNGPYERVVRWGSQANYQMAIITPNLLVQCFFAPYYDFMYPSDEPHPTM
jgi:hypothetical protein